jgi:large subunit ribosomal protein L4
MSVELKKFNATSGEFASIAATDLLWGTEPNTDLMHMAVVRQLNNARVGTASTKTRSEVRGGGRKPWKQKGTGRARAGSRTSSIWRGGGVSFGPKPRSFVSSLNRKMAFRALSSALSIRREQAVVIEDSALHLNKTAEFVALLGKLGVAGHKVLVISGYSEALHKVTRNLPQVSVVSPQNVGVVDVLNHDSLLVAEGALQLLEGRIV